MVVVAMTDALHSSLWYRVAGLKPQLQGHIEIRRHHYRGQRWYMLTDLASGNSHRINPATYAFVSLLDGRRTLDEIQAAVTRQQGDRAPTQEQTLQLLGQLHAADILQCDIPPDTAELFSRQRQQQHRQLLQRLLTPLAVRIPLLDPDRFLERWQHLVLPLFTRTGFCIWLGIVALAAVLAARYWPDISNNMIDRLLTPRNLLLLWLTYPLVKLLHELGHGFAVRIQGGEVHEMGIMLLALIPIPYVDASAATAFEDKYRRMVVGAAGMMVELLLAAAALFVWLNVEPGLVSAIAWNVMLIGGASTLFFNGNPLLRYDGYYIMVDAVEIPNLGTRANRYLGYLLQRYLFGVEDVASPVRAPGEAIWFVCYGLAAFAYRTTILFVIILYIAGKFFVIGMVLALWALLAQVLLPLAKHIAFLFSSQRLRNRRVRALLTTGALCTLLGGLLVFMPAPLTTRAEGVVWLPEQSQVRAGTDCFVTRLLVAPDARVSEHQAVIECEDPLLTARADLLEARLRELRARHTSTLQTDLLKAEGIREQITTAEAEYALLKTRLDALTLRSPGSGRLIIPRAASLQGSYIRKGDIIAWVTEGSADNARVVVSQTRGNLVRERTRGVEVRIAGHLDHVVAATVTRGVPAATDRLPSMALGSRGGGRIAVEPGEETGTRALQKIFQFDLALAEPLPSLHFGQRVQVRFDHGSEPLARQWQRSLRQLFLRRLGV
jgi:putative peptide zinc metalloprotease protein